MLVIGDKENFAGSLMHNTITNKDLIAKYFLKI
jgi:hypothetical protein